MARRDGDTYIVNGTKTWITNGGRGNCLALLVKTDLDASPQLRHVGAARVKEVDGYTVPRKLGKLGYRGVDTVRAAFDDVAVDADRLLGGDEGRGIAEVLGGSSWAGSTSRPAGSASRTLYCRPPCVR